MIAQRGLVLEDQEAWAQGVKIDGVAIRGVQVYHSPVPKIVNLLSNNFSDWESGHYNTNGSKGVFVSRIRLIDLWQVPQRQLYFNTNCSRDSINFVLRGFNADQIFVSNIGAVLNGYISNFAVNIAYLGISIYDSESIALTFADYQNMFANGNLKPWISMA